MRMEHPKPMDLISSMVAAEDKIMSYHIITPTVCDAEIAQNCRSVAEAYYSDPETFYMYNPVFKDYGTYSICGHPSESQIRWDFMNLWDDNASSCDTWETKALHLLMIAAAIDAGDITIIGQKDKDHAL